MDSLEFTIRKQTYRATPDPENTDAVTVTGPFTGKSIIPLVAQELVKAGFPASPWPGFWYPVQGVQGHIRFIANMTNAWGMAKEAFLEIVGADPVCQQCHADAKDLQRRAWLAEAACGLRVQPRQYWSEIRAIGDRYRARLVELWSDFQCPYKDRFSPERFLSFPTGAYRQGNGGPYEPQAGDLEYVLERLDEAIKAIAEIFNTPITQLWHRLTTRNEMDGTLRSSLTPAHSLAATPTGNRELTED